MSRLIFLLLIAVFVQTAQAKGRPAASRTHRSHTSRKVHTTRKVHPVKRSSSARTAFRHRNPCPATGKTTGPCPGYVIDHKQALKRGGPDTPENMQWQTTQAAKAKDRIE